MPQKVAVIVHSIDMVGYQATVVTDDGERRLVDTAGKPLTSKNLIGMREHLTSLQLSSIVMRHTSAYDEMVAQPERLDDNTLEIPVSVDSSLGLTGT